MRIEYEPTYEDLKSAYLAYRHRKPASMILDFTFFKLLPVTAAASIVIFVVIVQRSNHQLDSSILAWMSNLVPLQIAIVVGAFVERRVSLRRRIRNMFPAGAADKKVDIEIGEESVIASIPGFTRAEYAWKAISQFICSASVNLLYVSDERFILIPNRVLTTEQKASLRAAIARKGITTKSC